MVEQIETLRRYVGIQTPPSDVSLSDQVLTVSTKLKTVQRDLQKIHEEEEYMSVEWISWNRVRSGRAVR